MNLEVFYSIPVIGGAFVYLDRKINGKVAKETCMGIHQQLDKRLSDMHEDIKIIKEKLLEK